MDIHGQESRTLLHFQCSTPFLRKKRYSLHRFSQRSATRSIILIRFPVSPYNFCTSFVSGRACNRIQAYQLSPETGNQVVPTGQIQVKSCCAGFGSFFRVEAGSLYVCRDICRCTFLLWSIQPDDTNPVGWSAYRNSLVYPSMRLCRGQGNCRRTPFGN